jgi:hypothetical protein
LLSGSETVKTVGFFLRSLPTIENHGLIICATYNDKTLTHGLEAQKVVTAIDLNCEMIPFPRLSSIPGRLAPGIFQEYIAFSTLKLDKILKNRKKDSVKTTN